MCGFALTGKNNNFPWYRGLLTMKIRCEEKNIVIIIDSKLMLTEIIKLYPCIYCTSTNIDYFGLILGRSLLLPI